MLEEKLKGVHGVLGILGDLMSKFFKRVENIHKDYSQLANEINRVVGDKERAREIMNKWIPKINALQGM